MLSHAPIIYKLIVPFYQAQDPPTSPGAREFPEYCGSFEIQMKDEEPLTVTKDVNSDYMDDLL